MPGCLFSKELRSGARVELNHRSQACEVLAVTGLAPRNMTKGSIAAVSGWRPFARTRGVENPVRAERGERTPPVGFPQIPTTCVPWRQRCPKLARIRSNRIRECLGVIRRGGVDGLLFRDLYRE